MSDTIDQAYNRTKACRQWLKHHTDSSDAEQQAFSTGFNMGWAAKKKYPTKEKK